MYLIALTGGIASGKSLVAARLATLGAIHIDADVLAREVVEPGTAGLAAIAEVFGVEVLQPDGQLDRAALGAIIFTDADKRAALNAITHPLVRQLASQRIAEAKAVAVNAVVVYDVPLLAEAGPDGRRGFDAVVVVHADASERIRRMVDDRQMARQEAVDRINAQASDAARLAIADVVLDNNGSIDELLSQVDALWPTLQERSATHELRLEAEQPDSQG